MITTITGSKHITVEGSYVRVPYISPGAPGSGMVRWNSNINCMEINDGNSWQSMSSAAPVIGLTPETQDILEWAKQKRQQELDRKNLITSNPSLLPAWQEVERATEQFEILATLVK